MKTPKIDINRLLNQINSFSDDSQRLAVAITNSTAEDIVSDAQQRVPVDIGQLKQSIGKTTARIIYNKSFIFANTPYAAFVEFGTGGKVVIPKGFEALASPFKGKGIRERNYPPKPYLIPAYLNGLTAYRKKLTTAIEREAKKYNSKK
jgi:hypothetical protein